MEFLNLTYKYFIYLYQSDVFSLMFVHLRTRTEFSILNSVLTIDEICNFTKNNQSKAICMMDDFSLSGALQFSYYLSKNKIKPILGLNISIIDNIKTLNETKKLPYMGFIATSELGYKNLLKMLYKAEFSEQKNNQGQRYITIQDIESLNTEDVICITGGYNGLISRNFLNDTLDNCFIIAEKLYTIFKDRLYIELTRHGNKREFELENFLIDLAYKYNIPLVATNDVHFPKKENFDSYDILTCISSGQYVQEKNRETINENYYLKTEQEMIDLFSDIPEAIENTVIIAKRCNFYLEGNKPMLASFVSEDGISEDDYLKNISVKGLHERLKFENIIDKQEYEKYFQRLDFELSVVQKMGFAGYFLIVSDFIIWAKKNNIPVGPGRGSGAGSIIAWACKITNLDPIKYGLLFERFLNPERVSMPDFDIDFCQSKREEVINYVKNKYGNSRVASIITFGKLQAKAVLKDVGRVMQLSYGMVDEVCKMIPFSPLEQITIQKAIEMDPKLQQQIEDDPDIQNLVRIAMELEGLNRHTSTHAAGIIIGAMDLIEIAPMAKDENSDLPILAFNMKDAEKIGLLKFDFLGLKTLTVIQQTCDLIKHNTGNIINIDEVNIYDEQTFNLLRSTKLKGVFQLESNTPRDALAKIKTDRIEDLIAITSLNRPGPMEFIPEYVRRKLGQEVVIYPHPLLENTLKETFGIIIYQEQVMEVAKVIAGYTLSGADLLRRAMGKKIKEEMDEQRDVFIKGAQSTHNIDAQRASEIFDLVAKFAGYGFNKSHAAAYSVISYQTAYLKANYTIEFFVANLNLDINNTDKLNEFISDARNFDINIILPNVNVSDGYFTISKDRKSIIYGLGGLKSVGIVSAMEIAKIRSEIGEFKDIFDFAKKTGHKICNKKQLESLILTGAFDELHDKRKQLFESVDIITKYASDLEKSKNDNQSELFGESESSGNGSYVMKLKDIKIDYDKKEKLKYEMDFIGFYLSSHPLSDYENIIKSDKITKSCNLESITPGKKYTIQMVGVVTKIVQRFRKGGRFCFLHLSDLDGIFEVAIFNSDLIDKARDLLIEGHLNWLEISATRDDSGLRLIANDIADINNISDNYKSKQTSQSNNEAFKVNKAQEVNINAETQNHNLKSIIKTENKYAKYTPQISTINPSISKNLDKEISILTENIQNFDEYQEGISILIQNSQELRNMSKILAKLESDNGKKVVILYQGLILKMDKKYDISKLNLKKYE